MNGQLDRRSFVKGGAVVSAGALVGALMGCAKEKDGAGGKSAQKWDREEDVIVVGAGTGVYTALKLNDLGIKPLIIEKSKGMGGSTIFSSSVVWAPNNKLMKEKGDADSKEEALAYIKAGSGESYIPEMAEKFVDTVNEAIEDVSKLAGVEWEYWPGGIDYRCTIDGGKQMGRSLIPKVPQGGSIVGALQTALNDSCEKNKLQVLLETALVDFIYEKDDQGRIRVTGVLVKDSQGLKRIRARKAVVLATGGFDWNTEMMETYLRVPAKYSWGAPTGTGDGHLAAYRLGAQMRYMNHGWLSPGYKVEYERTFKEKTAHLSSAIRDYPKRGLIYVNKHGRRFCNETSTYDSLARVFSSQECGFEPRGWTNLPAYAICDSACVEAFGVGGAKKPGEAGVFKKYDTIEDLAKDCNINLEGLQEELAFFNEHAEKGEDPKFGRGQDYFGQNYFALPKEYEPTKRCLAPLAKAPYYAAELVPVVLGTMGGVKINTSSQVLDTKGEVIEGLYAHGNASGSAIGGAFYAGGGGTIGPSLTWGHIAAKHIAGQ